MTLSVGDTAPDFSLPDQDKQVVSLAELRGTPTLLVFYPFAFSGICTGELCQLRDELATYTDAGVTVLAISTDPVFSLKAFREQLQSGGDVTTAIYDAGYGSSSRVY